MVMLPRCGHPNWVIEFLPCRSLLRDETSIKTPKNRVSRANQPILEIGGPGQLSEFRGYYHTRRPHQGRQNLPLTWTPLERRRWHTRSKESDPEVTSSTTTATRPDEEGRLINCTRYGG